MPLATCYLLLGTSYLPVAAGILTNGIWHMAIAAHPLLMAARNACGSGQTWPTATDVG